MEEAEQIFEPTHDVGCNCEDCWWARGCVEVCSCCGIEI